MGQLTGLDGKVAIITGAGQGVGQGIAFALAKEGVAIAASGRTLAKVEDTVKQIRDFGGKAIATAANVSDEADLQRVVDDAQKAFGGVDILVNNAQDVPLGPLLSVTDEAFLSGFTSGPLATFRLMKLCYPIMKARGGGNIINFTTSASIRWDMANYGAYAAVKRGIGSLSRAAAAEWGPDNIRVNTIAPHALSPGLKQWIESRPEEAKAFFKTIPLGRVGDCEEDIGKFAVLLCSEHARFLTGATLPLDGGQAYWE